MIEYLATALSIMGLLLNIAKSWWCWVFFFVGTGLWLYISINEQRMLAIILFGVYEVINIYGFCKWRKL